jgi:hypothetical protein
VAEELIPIAQILAAVVLLPALLLCAPVDREADPPLLDEPTAERVMAALYKPDALQATLLTAWRCNWQHDDPKLVRRLLLALPPGPAAQAPVSVHGGKHLHVPPLPEPVSKKPTQAGVDSMDTSGEREREQEYIIGGIPYVLDDSAESPQLQPRQEREQDHH